MFNQVIVVGRLSNLDMISEEERMNGLMTIEVERAFAQPDGSFLSDHFPVRLWRGMMETISDSYQPGDLIGVNGRIEEDDGQLLIVAEKVSLIRKQQ